MIRKPYIHILLILMLGLAVYGNSVHVPFYFDDQICIENNPAIKNFSYFGDHARLARLPILQDIKNNFILRPVAYLTFAVNYRLHGLDVFGYHIVNITIHIFNAMLVYALLAYILRTPFFSEHTSRHGGRSSDGMLLPLFAGLLFVAHPLHTQAVTYICQRFISLATFFCLSAMVLYVAARLDASPTKRRAFYVLALVSAIVAMYTKETAFTLPLVIALFEFVFLTGDAFKKRLLLLAPFLCTMIIIPYKVISITKAAEKIEGSQLVTRSMDLVNFGALSRWDYLMTQFGVITTYLRLLALPVNQNFDYDYPLATSFFQPAVLLPLAFLLLLFGVSLYLLCRTARHGMESSPFLKLVAFGILWFFITLSVESSIIPIEDLIYEHRAYLPSIGICMAVLATLHMLTISCRFERHRRHVYISLCLVIGMLSVATIMRNRLWRDKTGFWRDVVGNSPAKARPHRSLAGNLAKEGNQIEAIKHFTTALALQPGYADAYIGLGSIALEQDRLEDALGYFTAALSSEPGNYKIYGYLSEVFLSHGKLNDARLSIERGLSVEPAMENAHNNLGVIFEMEGRLTEALREYTIALESDPENMELRSKIMSLSR